MVNIWELDSGWKQVLVLNYSPRPPYVRMTICSFFFNFKNLEKLTTICSLILGAFSKVFIIIHLFRLTTIWRVARPMELFSTRSTAGKIVSFFMKILIKSEVIPRKTGKTQKNTCGILPSVERWWPPKKKLQNSRK